ncbi:MAG: hypothetical protein JXQ27_10715 [Acidobacteria bacterium]|nr:hypothetical protein [Acidobacteriota bacterium]
MNDAERRFVDAPCPSSGDGPGLDKTRPAAPRRWLVAAAFLLGVAAGLLAWRDAFIEPYVINNDVGQHLFWMRQLQQPELFPDDLLVEYARHIQPVGFIAVYTAISFVMDPVLAGNLLAVLLLGASGAFLFLIVFRVVASPGAGILAVIIILASQEPLIWMAGGHARAFGLPLLITGIYTLMERRHWITAVLIILAALIYPPVCLLLAGTFALTVLARIRLLRRVRAHRAAVIALVAGSGLAAGILFANRAWRKNPDIGPMVSHAEVVANPAFHAGGRYAQWPVRPIWASTGKSMADGMLAGKGLEFLGRQGLIAETWVVPLAAGVAVLGLLGLWLFRRRGAFRIPAEWLCLAGAALVLYGLAAFLHPAILWPDRYSRYPLLILGVLTFTFLVYGAGRELERFVGRRYSGTRGRTARRALLMGAMVAIAGLALTQIRYAHLHDFSRYGPVYEFLKTIPADHRVAGPPNLADGIPVFARRSVFINYELSHPFFRAYWATVARRTREFFAAYYAADLTQVADFCRRHRIRWLVVDTGDYRALQRGIPPAYFEPFTRELREMLRNRRRFALLEVPDSWKAFRDGPFFVIGADRLTAEIEEGPTQMAPLRHAGEPPIPAGPASLTDRIRPYVPNPAVHRFPPFGE